MAARANLARVAEGSLAVAARKDDFPPPVPRRSVSPDRTLVGDWPCRCGQGYRVLVEPLTFWARSSCDGFQAEPVERCVSCGADLEEDFALEAARLVSASLLR